MKCKNKHIEVKGIISNSDNFYKKIDFDVIITNDENGKTLSINNGFTQFTIPVEPIEKYLK